PRPRLRHRRHRRRGRLDRRPLDRPRHEHRRLLRDACDGQADRDHRHELVGDEGRQGDRGLGQPRRHGTPAAARRRPGAGLSPQPQQQRRDSMGEYEDKVRALVLTMYNEVWNKGNMAAADDAVSPDFDDHPPTRFFDVGRTGPSALTEAAGSFRSAIPDFHDTPELVLVEGDRAAYLGMISGVQTGPMFGFDPKERRMRVWGINIFALRDGLISERWGQFDVLTMMMQLGLAPGPPVPEAPAEDPNQYGDPGRAAHDPPSDKEANKDVYRRMVE